MANDVTSPVSRLKPSAHTKHPLEPDEMNVSICIILNAETHRYDM
jgi:hypothetical protein